MKSSLKTSLFLGLILAFCASAQASIFTSSVDLGTQSTLQDNSASSAYDSLGNPITDPTHTIGTGDIITGTLRIEQDSSGNNINTPQQLVILFSAQITGPVVDAGLGHYLYNLAPVTAGPQSINSLLGGLGSGDAGSQFSTTLFSPRTVFALLESSNAPTTISHTLAADLSNFKNETAGVSYSLDLTGGLRLGPNQFGSTDFFQAELDKGRFASSTTPAPTLGDLGLFAATHKGAIVGSDSGAFTVFINNSGLSFGPVIQADKGYFNPPTYSSQDHTGQIVFDADLKTPKAGQAVLGYQFSDDTTIGLLATAAVPEPSSILILGGLGCFMGMVLRRRRNSKIAA